MSTDKTAEASGGVVTSSTSALETEQKLEEYSHRETWPEWATKTFDFLSTYTFIGMLYLFYMNAQVDQVEKVLQILLLTATLIFAMASSMASSITRDDFDYFLDYCKDSDNSDFRDCLVKNGRGTFGGIEGTCNMPVRWFQSNITTSHHILAVALVSGVILYVFFTAYARDMKSAVKKGADARAANLRTWIVFITLILAAWLLVVVGIIFYLQSYLHASTIQFPIFAWEEGKCDSVTALSTARALANVTGLIAAIAFGVLPIVMGYIAGHPDNLAIEGHED